MCLKGESVAGFADGLSTGLDLWEEKEYRTCHFVPQAENFYGEEIHPKANRRQLSSCRTRDPECKQDVPTLMK